MTNIKKNPTSLYKAFFHEGAFESVSYDFPNFISQQPPIFLNLLPVKRGGGGETTNSQKLL